MSEKTAKNQKKADLILMNKQIEKELNGVREKAQKDKDKTKDTFNNAMLVWDRQLTGQIEARQTVQGWLAVHKVVQELGYESEISSDAEVTLAVSVIPLLKKMKKIVAKITYEDLTKEEFEDPFDGQDLIKKDFIKSKPKHIIEFVWEAIHFEVVRSMVNEIFSCRNDIMMAIEQADKDVEEAESWAKELTSKK